jgi:hypothetical protein
MRTIVELEPHNCRTANVLACNYNKSAQKKKYYSLSLEKFKLKVIEFIKQINENSVKLANWNKPNRYKTGFVRISMILQM